MAFIFILFRHVDLGEMKMMSGSVSALNMLLLLVLKDLLLVKNVFFPPFKNKNCCLAVSPRKNTHTQYILVISYR